MNMVDAMIVLYLVFTVFAITGAWNETKRKD